MSSARPYEPRESVTVAIRERGDLLSLAQEATGGRLRQMGAEYRGPCPLHQGNGPNFSVNATENVFHCFTCNAGGDVFDFVRQWCGLSFPDARAYVARRAGMPPDTLRNSPFPLPPSSPHRHLSPAEKGRVSNREVLNAVREQGCSTSEPPDVYESVQSLLPLGPTGARYLASRGFDPVPAQHYGFRSLESRAAWAQLRRELDESFMHAEIELAGLHRFPWKGEHPALVIPYVYHGQTIGLRFRSLLPNARKGLRYRDLVDNRPPLPFNATALDGAGPLHLVEGELNALTLASYGLRTIGLPGAGAWEVEWTAQIRTAIGSDGLLIAWYDEDPAGAKGRAALATALRDACGLDWLDIHGRAALLTGGDANDLHCAGTLQHVLEAAGVL